MKQGTLRVGSALSALMVAGALGACGDNGVDELDVDGPAVQTTDSELGTILADAEGRTLYLFTEDSPGTSTCVDECLEAWPAVGGDVEAAGEVDPDLLGTIERPDGTTQATYNDWPLYYYADDAAPGELNGQGVNDVWWVVTPEGSPIEEMPEDDDGGVGY
ncbi:hypothetical protein [Haloechinothrix sp. LS1_15]|uniref:COG4315 family predicted lipoprotein n=1 Tax=Haloechinothrix sp. LS1_15 TaxID=2652248 RepID=UPI0029474A06|nr:hypothetical protein [Haloechinothrix sp. LS1_15]MDV6011246.1 hypothetical protein [Haloechinothrix sp. LS1_15]